MGGYNAHEEAKKLKGTQDKVVIDYEKKEVKIFNHLDLQILYAETVDDMLALDEELIKIGSYFINQHEFVFDSESKMPQSALDRGEIALDLIKAELNF